MLSTENIGLKKPGYNDEADIAVINENSDIIDREFGNRYLKSETYSVEQANNAIAQAIEALPNGLVYRGAVNYYKDLPTDSNELGDTYSVKYQGETGTTADGNEYAWGEYDGTLQWIKLGVNAYTKDEIDEQRSSIESDISKAESEIEYNKIKWGRVLASGLTSGTAGWYKIASCELAVPSESTTRNATFLISHHSGTWGILKTHIIINPSNVSKFVMTSIMQGINTKNIIGIAKRENNVQKCEIWCKCTYAGEYYRFVIFDNGSSGIPNNYNEFWQLHSTTAYQTNEPSDYDNKAETTDVIKDLSDRITALENK